MISSPLYYIGICDMALHSYRTAFAVSYSDVQSNVSDSYFYGVSDVEEPDGVRELAFLIVGIGDFLSSSGLADIYIGDAIAFRDGAYRYWEKYKDYPGTDFELIRVISLIDNVWDDWNIVTWDRILDQILYLDFVLESDDRVIVYIATHGDTSGNIYMGDGTAVSPDTLSSVLSEHFGDTLDLLWIAACYSSVAVNRISDNLEDNEAIYLGYAYKLYYDDALDAVTSFWDKLYENDLSVEAWYEWYTEYYNSLWVMIDNWPGYLILRYYDPYYPPPPPGPIPPWPGPIPTAISP